MPKDVSFVSSSPNPAYSARIFFSIGKPFPMRLICLAFSPDFASHDPTRSSSPCFFPLVHPALSSAFRTRFGLSESASFFSLIELPVS
jgi:hypothetical protein